MNNRFCVNHLHFRRSLPERDVGKAQKIYTGNESFTALIGTEPKASNTLDRSAGNDLRTGDALGGIAGINDQLGFGDDAAVVVVGVVGDDQHTIILAEVFQF